MVTYSRQLYHFVTPRGNAVSMAIRFQEDGTAPGTATSDYNTLFSALNEDEYRFAQLPELRGLAIDVGAHIGSVSIGLAIDNPDLRVIAVEAVPPNVELLRENIKLNRLEGRITVIDKAAAGPTDTETTVYYGWSGNATTEHHAFIGNSKLAYDSGGANEPIAAVTPCVSLGSLIGDGWATLLKIDCEGCEYSFLTDHAIERVERIVGEWHNVRDHKQSDILDLLGATHHVTFSGPVEGPGGFVADRR